MFDIIGDIHGQATKLKSLLYKLGYKKTRSGFQHLKYKAIFVGDLIDRGPYQLETLTIVKEMVDNGNAYVVMGNHEFNAIGWKTNNEREADTFLRKHNYANHKQHKAFLMQIGENSQQHLYWINWFKSLPLFLDFDKIRVIHACWDSNIIRLILPYLEHNNGLKEQYIQQAFNPSSALFNYCETLLKGKEVTLPDGISYHDKEGTQRHKSRIKWWLKQADTLNELCLIPDDEKLPALEQKVKLPLDGYQEQKIVFFGHYWLTGKPSIQTNKVTCVDYSAAIESGKLVAYRWEGEEILTNKHFIY
ncbi:metallophosphoesterase [Orbus sturtevantii]|uniref:metallophosphoesterase n=1 Tax=Orbus sturtevantii TaxID=3074109 RepID=UPI00370D7838